VSDQQKWHSYPLTRTAPTYPHTLQISMPPPFLIPRQQPVPSGRLPADVSTGPPLDPMETTSHISSFDGQRSGGGGLGVDDSSPSRAAWQEMSGGSGEQGRLRGADAATAAGASGPVGPDLATAVVVVTARRMH
jgi:hypothetical protein